MFILLDIQVLLGASLNSREWSAGGGGRVEGGKVGEVGVGPASSPGQDEKRNSSACPNGDCP
jgi:hypothetical protein